MAGNLTGMLRDQLERRLEQVNLLAAKKDQSVVDARAWVEAMLGFEVYSHHLLDAISAPAHGDDGHANPHNHG